MKNVKFILPVISGTLLCSIGFFCSCIPYLNLSSQSLMFALLFFDICAIAIVIIALTYKTAHIRETLFRTVAQLVVYFVLWIVGAYARIWHAIYQVITLHSSASTDNVSGLLWIIFTILIFVLSLVILIVQLICSVTKRRFSCHIQRPPIDPK